MVPSPSAVRHTGGAESSLRTARRTGISHSQSAIISAGNIRTCVHFRERAIISVLPRHIRPDLIAPYFSKDS